MDWEGGIRVDRFPAIAVDAMKAEPAELRTTAERPASPISARSNRVWPALVQLITVCGRPRGFQTAPTG